MTVKAPALFGRLRFDVRGLRPGLGWLRRFRRRGDGMAGEPRKPFSRPLLAAVALVAVAYAGLAGWLALNAEATREAWQASIPSATVAAAPPPPPPAPEPKAAASAGPAPLPTDAAPLPLPGVPAAAVTLVPAPVPGLVEDSRNGPLPRIAQDGRKPWQVYARPFPATDKRPRVAIVMSDLGLSGVTTGNALAKLSPGITLAFLPYAERLDDWIERARTKGHEVMLSVPMEPLNYPRDDPGPNALLTMLGPDRNVERLEWSLGKAVGYVGITSTTGSKFTANPA
ncbi:divergent polysaccharide deacetylase family protein, partial [Azospirillum sp. B506]|uniref:divergent polysaccharide deacetylase family protein n=1 Tax=Azospirillum sp. B506 TaxID=137721 RepID=UPI001FCB6565